MSKTRNLTSLIAASGVVAAMGATQSAGAADVAAPDRAPLVLAQGQSFDDQTIEAIAAAQVEIREIRATWQSEAQQTQGGEQLEQMRQRATEKMVDAIREQGLTVEDYNTFMEAANQNPDLIDRLNDAMSDMSG